MQTTKRKPKPKKVKDYISPEGKKIIAKVLNDFSKRKRKLDMQEIIKDECGTVCCFAGGIMIEHLGAKQAYGIRQPLAYVVANALGLERDSSAHRIFLMLFPVSLAYWTNEEQKLYNSGHRTRALRMAVARTMETEV